MSDFYTEQEIWGDIDRWDNNSYVQDFHEDEAAYNEDYSEILTPRIPELVGVNSPSLTPTQRTLVEAATSIDSTQTWTTIGIAGHIDPELKVDEVEFTVFSRGPIRLVNGDAFAEIQDMVELDVDPNADGPLAQQVISFDGDSAGLKVFVGILNDELDTGSESQENTIETWRKTDPLGILNAFIRSAVASDSTVD